MANQIMITGNLTRDPELKYTPSVTAITRFTVADNRRKKVDNEWVDGETTFFDCQVWGAMAEHAANTLHKGDKVTLVGSISSRKWQTQDGQDRTSWEVTCSELAVTLGGKPAKTAQTGRSDDPWANTQPEAPF